MEDQKQNGFDVDLAWSMVPKKPLRRIDEWNEAMMLMGALFASQDVGTELYTGRNRIRRIEGARIVHTQCNEVLLDRGPEEMERGADRLQIKLQSGGESHYVYGGRSLHLKPGDVLIEDMSVPQQLHALGDWQQNIISLDNAALDRMFPEGRPLDGIVLPSGSGVADLTGTYLRSIASNAGELSEQAMQAAVRHVCQLVTLAQEGTRPADREYLRDGVRAARLARAMRYIDQHLDDAALRPTQVATALGMSVRQLYELFERSGTSVAECIRNRRLARCLKDLTDPKNSHHSVADVAFRWGFGDLSTFHRSFRKSFGVTPGDVRLAADERTERFLAASSEPVT
jgi:AraC-like DNA-binding protein